LIAGDVSSLLSFEMSINKGIVLNQPVVGILFFLETENEWNVASKDNFELKV